MLILSSLRPSVQHSHKSVAAASTSQGQAIGLHQPNSRHGHSIGQLRGERWKSSRALPHGLEGGMSRTARR